MSQSSHSLSSPQTEQHSFCTEYLKSHIKQWAESTYDKPWLAVFICIVMLAASAYEARHVQMDMSTEAMLHKDDPARINYDAFRATFGREDGIIILLPTQGLLSKALMKKYIRLTAIHRKPCSSHT